MALHPLKTEGMWIGRRRNDTTAWHPAMYDDTSTLGGAHAASSTPPAQPRLAWVPPSGSLGVLGAKIGHGITEESVWDGVVARMQARVMMWGRIRL